MDTPERPRAVGTSVPRKEDRRLLTGRGDFVADRRLPGQLEVAFVRSPHAAARLTGVDVSAAEALAGVHRVLVAADLAAVSGPMHHVLGPPKPLPFRMFPLAEGDVRFVG